MGICRELGKLAGKAETVGPRPEVSTTALAEHGYFDVLNCLRCSLMKG
jgi:hypothetical protein